MAVTVVSFRWLEILEKEFDKNFVDLDLLIGDLDGDEPDLVYSARQKLAGLSSCFAQLTHKAQTIFQNSAKTEAELVDLRTELVQCKTRQEVLEEDCRNLLLQLHSLQLDRLPSNQNPEQYKEKIDNALKHSPSKGSYSEDTSLKHSAEVKRLRHELSQFATENAALRTSVLALTSEVYGARLAAKYLDKELAGRIQQLQLLGKDMRTDVRDKLWRQLESEILLHRHKTVIRACRNRPHMDLLAPTRHHSVGKDDRLNNNAIHSRRADEEEPPCAVGEKRVVVVRRHEGQGLGISITGGREHGVPILISELEEGGPAYQCRNLFVGDAILSVDDMSLENASHFEAVKVLTSMKGEDVTLVVQYIAVDTDEETSLSEDLYGYRYRFFDTDVMDSTDVLGLHPEHLDPGHLVNTPTAPRTPEDVHHDSGVRDDASCSWKRTSSELISNPETPPLVDLGKPADRLDIELYGQRFRTDIDCSVLGELLSSAEEIVNSNLPLSPKKTYEVAVTVEQQPVPEVVKPCPNESPKKGKSIDNTESPKQPKCLERPDIVRRSAKCAGSKSDGTPCLDYIDATIFSGLEDTSVLDNIVKSFSEDDFSCVEAPGASDSGLYSSDDTKSHTRFNHRAPYLPSLDNSPEKVELRTLHQIFDRSFSSNLSSPHESTSFDDDIFSTEHSDEKNGNYYLDDFRNKMNDMKNAYNPKKIQKFYPKNIDEVMKKPKRSADGQKRPKSMRKSKEGKSERRKCTRDDGDCSVRKPGFKVTERFDENLLEYSVKDIDAEDAMEATRLLSLQYGLRLPETRRTPRSSEESLKMGESSKTTPSPPAEKPRPPSTARFDSFGDPDFGTPV